MSRDLTTKEANSLTECESTIERGLSTFVEVGRALMEIRDAKLYRASHKTFEHYCDDRWKFTRQRAYQLIDQARVVKAVADASGADLSNAFDISARDTAALKGELPTVTAEIKDRVERGEDAAKATADVIAEHRADRAFRGKKPDPALEAFHQSARESLPQAIKEHEAAKANRRSGGGQTAAPEVDERDARIAALEGENGDLKSKIKLFDDMRLQYERGGFEQVIADKDEEIRVLKTRVSAESREKVKNLNAIEWWKKKAIELGYSRDKIIPLDEAANG